MPQTFHRSDGPPKQARADASFGGDCEWRGIQSRHVRPKRDIAGRDGVSVATQRVDDERKIDYLHRERLSKSTEGHACGDAALGHSTGHGSRGRVEALGELNASFFC